MQANFFISMYEIQMSQVRFITNHNTLVSSTKLMKFINMSVLGYNLSFADPRLFLCKTSYQIALYGAGSKIQVTLTPADNPI